MKWIFLPAASEMLGCMAFAEGMAEAGQTPHEVPWITIGVQTGNLLLLVGILSFILRKAVKDHFSKRAENYKELVDRAERAKREAEKNQMDAKGRLLQLEQSAAQSEARALKEADDLKKSLMHEAKELAAKLEKEAQQTTMIELEKAKAELRADLLRQALTISEQELTKGLSSSAQRELQNEFVEKIEMVSG